MHYNRGVLSKHISSIILSPKRCPNLFTNNHRFISSSSSSNAGRSSGSPHSNTGTGVQSLVRSISTGVFVIGSSLGLCYWSDTNSTVLAYADSQAQLQDAVPKKPPIFLFGGTLTPYIFILIHYANNAIATITQKTRVRSPCSYYINFLEDSIFDYI